MDEVVAAALQAMQRREWERVRPLLHPYLHWTEADGRTARGRRTVLARLAAEPAEIAHPSSVELRDGQLYRWVEAAPAPERRSI